MGVEIKPNPDLSTKPDPELCVDMARWIPGHIFFEPGEEMFAGHYATGKLLLTEWQAQNLIEGLQYALREQKLIRAERKNYPFAYTEWHPES